LATVEELRDRSGTLFTELLRAQAAEPKAGEFSWFNMDDAVAAATLSFRLAALAASGESVEEGLSAALDDADQQSQKARPEEVQIGLALFVTHNHEGRRLAKPRTVAAAPGLFTPPRARGKAPAVSIGGPSPGLDYWREDVLANEHHQHWHEVYPFTGLPPRSFSDWLADHTTEDFVEILETLDPSQAWRDIVPTLTPAQLAGLFAQVLDLEGRLPREVYSKLFTLNDRQGELFFYMHAQMLARYDAELLSHGLDRVEPFGPDEWDDPIAAGHDPIEIDGFGRREEKEALPSEAGTALQALWDEIDQALGAAQLRGLDDQTQVPIDRTNLGEAVEAAVPQLRALAEDAYGGIHGSGHVFIARLAAPGPGVMASTVTAIRDPVFWQWHKAIDNLNARWQDDLDPYPFDDAPPVLVRNALDASADTPWTSPDIILCRTSDLPEGTDPAELGTQLFGGASWDTDFTSAQASADGTSLETLGELTTTMATVNFGGAARRYLTHEPFSYFLRIENTTPNPLDLTVRIFLVPANLAGDRRAWMEMDKFLVDLEPGKQVVYRPDTESSIVKRPAETSPAAVIPSGNEPDERSYCDCGWPYTLLLPRGTSEGMQFRLLVLATDATIDQLQDPEQCGSMSYCGAVDRYPDTRDMGYPFSRPFGSAESAISDRIVALDSAAARTVNIRHT
jgi:hypothetical protein